MGAAGSAGRVPRVVDGGAGVSDVDDGDRSCGACGGEGRWHDCGEDACCCAEPLDDNIECAVCEGSGCVGSGDSYDDQPFFDPARVPKMRDWPRPTWRQRLRWLWWRWTGRRGPEPHRDGVYPMTTHYEETVRFVARVACPHGIRDAADVCYLCFMAGRK